MQNETGGVAGSLLVKFSRKSLLESLRAIGKERYWPENNIALAGDEFLHANGETNEEAIVHHVRALVDEAIREHLRRT